LRRWTENSGIPFKKCRATTRRLNRNCLTEAFDSIRTWGPIILF